MNKRGIKQELWNHHRYKGTGEYYVLEGDPNEVKNEKKIREEHWGRKEDCAKCRKLRNNIGEFKNTFTQLGFFIIGLGVVVAILVVLTIGVIYFKSP